MGDFPKEFWTAAGVMIGATITCLVTFVNAVIQRTAERESLLKAWLLDEGLAVVHKHLAKLSGELSTQNMQQIRKLRAETNALPEIEILSARYGVDWAERYQATLDVIFRQASEGSLDGIPALRERVQKLSLQVSRVYEWQARHLPAPSWRRKLAAKWIAARVNRVARS